MLIELLVPPIIATAFAEVGKGVASEVGKRLVDAFSSVYQRINGHPLDPATLDPREIDTVVTNSSEIRQIADEYLAHSTALKRAALVKQALEGARILWIDNHPSWNRLECRALEGVGVHILNVETTSSALSCLASEDFDAIVSDIDRGEGKTEGLTALPRLREAAPTTPVIFYVGRVDGPTPARAFGITADPNELMHLCMDAFERSRI